MVVNKNIVRGDYIVAGCVVLLRIFAVEARLGVSGVALNGKEHAAEHEEGVAIRITCVLVCKMQVFERPW
eukprot:CAMPEP_0119347406 /NCGR_PEP_ID=MMETSP1333-20130426/108509_1 /TAXON_ID=418940 /ORGANISM="Scyphosphaera apsteinii, Strain RCC1455" /LENGTH=69 /DNA_ID=CAMNT_0007359951 /DNA_START=870 /DNA_END=1079 /DNA_ORIENTATION=+